MCEAAERLRSDQAHRANAPALGVSSREGSEGNHHIPVCVSRHQAPVLARRARSGVDFGLR